MDSRLNKPAYKRDLPNFAGSNPVLTTKLPGVITPWPGRFETTEIDCGVRCTDIKPGVGFDSPLVNKGLGLATHPLTILFPYSLRRFVDTNSWYRVECSVSLGWSEHGRTSPRS